MLTLLQNLLMMRYVSLPHKISGYYADSAQSYLRSSASQSSTGPAALSISAASPTTIAQPPTPQPDAVWFTPCWTSSTNNISTTDMLPQSQELPRARLFSVSSAFDFGTETPCNYRSALRMSRLWQFEAHLKLESDRELINKRVAHEELIAMTG